MCPFTYCCLYVDDTMDKDKNFCLKKKTGGQYMLKKTHPYYLQVQSQMFLTWSSYCDFVLHTEKDLVITRVHADNDVWEDVVEKAEIFFHQYIVSELSCVHTQEAVDGVCV